MIRLEKEKEETLDKILAKIENPLLPLSHFKAEYMRLLTDYAKQNYFIRDYVFRYMRAIDKREK